MTGNSVISAFLEGNAFERLCDSQVGRLYLLAKNKENGHLMAYLLIFQNDNYRRKQEEMLNMAQRDQLTGLFNRYMLESILKEYVSSQNSASAILIAFDLNLFKPVNDKYGHHVGDLMLIAMAERLEQVFFRRRQEIIFREGGDEFLVLMKDATSPEAIERLRKITGSPIFVTLEDGRKAECTVSAGYTEFTGQNRNHKALLKAADRALYHVKEHGRMGFWKEETPPEE